MIAIGAATDGPGIRLQPGLSNVGLGTYRMAGAAATPRRAQAVSVRDGLTEACHDWSDDVHEIVDVHADRIAVRPGVKRDDRLQRERRVQEDPLMVQRPEWRHRAGLTLGEQTRELVFAGEANSRRIRDLRQPRQIDEKVCRHNRKNRTPVGKAGNRFCPPHARGMRHGGLFGCCERRRVRER